MSSNHDVTNSLPRNDDEDGGGAANEVVSSFFLLFFSVQEVIVAFVHEGEEVFLFIKFFFRSAAIFFNLDNVERNSSSRSSNPKMKSPSLLSLLSSLEALPSTPDHGDGYGKRMLKDLEKNERRDDDASCVGEEDIDDEGDVDLSDGMGDASEAESIRSLIKLLLLLLLSVEVGVVAVAAVIVVLGDETLLLPPPKPNKVGTLVIRSNIDRRSFIVDDDDDSCF